MKPESNPLRDLLAFLTNPIWPTAVFWVVLLAGPASRSPAGSGTRRSGRRTPLASPCCA